MNYGIAIEHEVAGLECRHWLRICGKDILEFTEAEGALWYIDNILRAPKDSAVAFTVRELAFQGLTPEDEGSEGKQRG